MKLIIVNFISFSLFSFALAYPSSKTNLGIYGGAAATAGQFPYIVSVQQCYWLLGCSHYCAGAVIAPTWIVTAAQCYESGVSYKVLAGVLNLNENSDYRELFDVSQGIVNSDFGGGDNPINDIALLELSSPMTYNARLLPIGLPVKNAEPTGDAVVMGWGDVDGNDNYPNTLQYVNLTLMDSEDCKSTLDGILEPNYDDPFDGSVQLCTSDANQGRSICSGDGGSPLVQNGTMIGIVSWYISPCGSRGAPSVYTKVSNYIDWITENMNG